MKKLVVGLLALCAWYDGLCSVLAQDQTASTVQEERLPTPSDKQPEAGGKRAREFQGDDIGQVFRLLARQAKVNLAVGENVKGTVNVRLESASAFDAIEIMVHQYKLVMTKDEKGVYYINAPEPAAAGLDLLAKPETAERVAAYKRHLYDALIKQNFSPGEALQLTSASDPTATLLLLDRKPEPVPPK